MVVQGCVCGRLVSCRVALMCDVDSVMFDIAVRIRVFVAAQWFLMRWFDWWIAWTECGYVLFGCVSWFYRFGAVICLECHLVRLVDFRMCRATFHDE